MSFLIAGLQLNSIFIQKETPAPVLSWQLSEIFNNDLFNFEKKHYYKKRDQIYIPNLMTQLLRQDFCISACDDNKVYKVLSVEQNH